MTLAIERDSHIFEREAHDHYVDQEWCSQRLFATELFVTEVWDPACGFGRIVDSAKSAGHAAFGTDIVDRGYPFCTPLDFLSPAVDKLGHPGNIVTNPPFDLFEPFVRQALKLARLRVAMIWLVRRLPAARWLSTTPLSKVLLLTPRPSMPTGAYITAGGKVGGGTQDFCWLIWDQDHTGKPEIGWLHRDAQ